MGTAKGRRADQGVSVESFARIWSRGWGLRSLGGGVRGEMESRVSRGGLGADGVATEQVKRWIISPLWGKQAQR